MMIENSDYQLLNRKGNKDRLLGEYTSLDGEVASFLLVIKPSHEGSLQCVAKAQNNTNIEPMVSSIHYLRVLGKSIVLLSNMASLQKQH